MAETMKPLLLAAASMAGTRKKADLPNPMIPVYVTVCRCRQSLAHVTSWRTGGCKFRVGRLIHGASTDTIDARICRSQTAKIAYCPGASSLVLQLRGPHLSTCP